MRRCSNRLPDRCPLLVSNDQTLPLLPLLFMNFQCHVRNQLLLLNNLTPQQVESLFVSHVVSLSDEKVDSATVRGLGGVQNTDKLIRSLKQLMHELTFSSLTPDQTKQSLTNQVKGLSEQKVECLSKLCHDNMRDWKNMQLASGEQQLKDVDWNLKVVSCVGDECRVQLNLKTGQSSQSLDLNHSSMSHLYSKLEEIQQQLDQIARGKK